jgi:hypothetical protein
MTVAAKKHLEQRHSVRLRIGTPVTIPWVSKKGVTFELSDGGEKIGEIRVTGAHVHVRRSQKQKWKQFTFSEVLRRLAPE